MSKRVSNDFKLFYYADESWLTFTKREKENRSLPASKCRMIHSQPPTLQKSSIILRGKFPTHCFSWQMHYFECVSRIGRSHNTDNLPLFQRVKVAVDLWRKTCGYEKRLYRLQTDEKTWKQVFRPPRKGTKFVFVSFRRLSIYDIVIV